MADPIKIRAQVQGDEADIKILMSHPMETGLRKDAKTGETIPAHFIQKVVAQLNGKTVLDAQWGQAVSRNPFLGFKVKGAKPGDKLTVSWIDNKGGTGNAEAVLTAAT